jgi:hypothetical protein
VLFAFSSRPCGGWNARISVPSIISSFAICSQTDTWQGRGKPRTAIGVLTARTRGSLRTAALSMRADSGSVPFDTHQGRVGETGTCPALVPHPMACFMLRNTYACIGCMGRKKCRQATCGHSGACPVSADARLQDRPVEYLLKLTELIG